MSVANLENFELDGDILIDSWSSVEIEAMGTSGMDTYYYFNTLDHLKLIEDVEESGGYMSGFVPKYVINLCHTWAESGGFKFMPLKDYLIKVLNIVDVEVKDL